MPSPVGHVLGGVAVYLVGTRNAARSRFIFAATLLGSIAPDFDILPGIIIGKMSAFHHGVSHSLTFAALFGAIVFFWVRRYQKEIAVRAAIIAALAYTSHIFLDFVNVYDGTRGVPAIWPLSDRLLGLDLGLLGYFYYTDKGLWSVVRWDNVPAFLREVLFIGGPVLLLLWRERRSTQRLAKRIPEAIRKRPGKVVGALK
jgi:membrane-bound metal-dependent hydrolase YbcI (DUF457 family)